MSILLDALKKSEQDRQLGHVPTLQNRPDDPERGRHPLNPWIILTMVLMSVSVMGWFGWQQFRQTPGEPVALVAAQAGDDETLPAGEPPQNRTRTESYQSENEKSLPKPVDPGSSKVKAGADRDRVARSVSAFKAENVEPVPGAQSAQVVAVTESISSPDPADDASAERTEVLASANGDSPRHGVDPHIAEPISYWELPQGIRDNLPEIRITVLVYAEHPGDRFLLSNGQRLVEKDELDGGLVLDEIRKDGAVFLYRNYRFLVKS
jgi:general secretion pathway protein B